MSEVETVGPWEETRTEKNILIGWQRKDARGRTCALVSTPGDADGGRYGWFAMNEKGESRGNLTAGMKAATSIIAMGLADKALHELGLRL